MSRIKKYIGVVLITFLCFNNHSIIAQNENNFEIGKAIDIYATILKELNLNYVDSIDAQKLLNTSLKAMLEDLDPYTIYVSEAEVEDFDILTQGSYGGIGVGIHQHKGKVVVSNIYQGFPGDKVGLKSGDIFLALNDSSVVGFTSSQVSDILKDVPGSTVKAKMNRPGTEEPIEFNIKREQIKIKNVPYYTVLEDKIGYIILTGFSQDAALEFRNAFNDLKDNHDIENLIIDLRGNGGGIINEAADILSMFVSRGTEVVNTKGKIVNQNRAYKTRFAPIDKKIPIVVLVDQNSASSSEIVAGALQDLDRAVIMGQRTYGKGLVQHIIPLRYNTRVKITIAKYYIPSGRCIQEINYANDALKKADSTKVYLTKSGRKVKGGKGIAPDIKTPRRTLSNITATLYGKLLIFNFATDHLKGLTEIPQVSDYQITDEVYDAFIKYISDKDYTYKTESEQTLEHLKKTAESENYYDAIKEALTNVEEAMKKDKEADLIKHKEEIKKLIKHEIVSRFYYDAGRIQASLEGDPSTEAAIKLLKNKEEYKHILSVSKK